ncbi:caspase family protein [Tardiphaga sp. 813_E8_N1_3]|uniref:caspase family protein n=1 Tax=Tardiphaga sp. 813_E8_N1_3 TaxID=3240760 RepID=UPI003F27EB2D
MTSISKFAAFLLALMLVGGSTSNAAPSERRIALVIGNANYQAGALPTPANDAGLIAQTLQAAGFDVTGARDLDQDSLRRTFREFLDKASSSGPETVAFIYLGGYGLQLEGENYFVPVDARIARDVNISAEALRLSDYMAPLAALKLKASMVVLDIARANPFAKTGAPLTGGLALVEPEQGMFIAFNSAPGTVAPSEAGPYSAYAQALAEMMREGGLRVEDLFSRIRLRVNETTKGAEVPWNASKLEAPFYFFERAPDAPPPAVSREQTSAIRSRPLRDFSSQEAYLAAVDRDTLEDYEAFLAAYPNDPMARRVRAIVAARREAITWRRTRGVNTPPAYWSYLRRYPRGAHADDARRRLAYLSAAFEPPPQFSVIAYDVPPPPPEEVIYVERPVLMFDDPDFGFAPPPPPPIIFLPPRPVYFVDLPPPPPPVYAFILPVPDYSPVPVWVRPPEYVAPPPSNIIYNNIHNTVVVNNTTNVVTITNPSGQAQTLAPPPAAPVQGVGQAPVPSSRVGGVIAAGVAGAGAAALLAPSLPPSVATKAALAPNPPPVQTPKPVVPAQPAPSQAQSTPATGPTPPPGAVGPDGKPVPSALPPAGTKSAPATTGPAPTSPTNVAPGTPPLTAVKPGTPPASAAPLTPNAISKPPGQTLPGSNGQPLPPIPGAAPGASPASGAKSSPAATPVPAAPVAPGANKPGSALPGTNGQPLPPVTSPKASPPVGAKSSQTPGPAPAVPAAPNSATKPAATPPAARPAPPPPPAARPAPPPPPAARPAPPPPPAARPAPPPPPAARPAPPPPPVARPAPPPPPAARPAPPPPPAARPAPPAARCVLPNGQPCPPPR